MDEEKPITDKENFPADEKSTRILDLRPMQEIAYLDGVSDGYRKAVHDFLLWSLAFFVVAVLARSLDATN